MDFKLKFVLHIEWMWTWVGDISFYIFYLHFSDFSNIWYRFWYMFMNKYQIDLKLLWQLFPHGMKFLWITVIYNIKTCDNRATVIEMVEL